MISFKIPQKQLDVSLLPGGSDRVKVPFHYGDATPAVIYQIPADGIIYSVEIVIETPFNGANPSLKVGATLNGLGVLDSLMQSNQNNPSEIGSYESSPNLRFPAPFDAVLSIDPGQGCTAGKGMIILSI